MATVRRNQLRRAVVVVSVGVATLLVGIVWQSDRLTLLGLLLAVPQTVEAVLNLRSARVAIVDDSARRHELARRMLDAHRSDELTLSIPGGGTIDLAYRAQHEFATFRSRAEGTARFDDLVAAVTRMDGPLVLVGAPGAGKSLTARRMVTALLRNAAAGDGPLAERFSLARWDADRLPLADWIAREWSRRREYGLDAAEARRLALDPQVVLVLDGLDEMPDHRRRTCVAGINAFVDVHPAARLVVCCREEEYGLLDGRIESRHVRRIEPLEAHAVNDFIAEHAPPAWAPVQAALAHDPDLHALLNKPLMLVAALRGLRDDPTVLLEGSLRQRQHGLWDCYVDAMLRLGDRSCGSVEERRRWLEDVAITMVATGTYELVPGRLGADALRLVRRVCLGQGASGPRDLRAFLDDCVARHLLRHTGTGYQCFHRQLLGHLVARASFADGKHALRRRLLAPVRSEAWAWNRLAAEAMAAGHYEAATSMAGRAVDVAPGHPTFLGDLAVYLMVTGRLDDAAGVAVRAEAADPSSWRPPSTLAYALFALGDLDGSADARRRAWAKGHQPSDGSLLAYALDLLGRHDEAAEVLKELGTVEHDGGLRQGHVLALTALARPGETAQALFPLDIQKARSAWMIFSVPSRAAEPLVPCEAFEIVELEPGFTQLIVAATGHLANPWGDYHEIDLAIPARPIGAPEDTTAAYIFGCFASQRFGREAGYHGLAFPTVAADIAVGYTHERVTFDLVEGGQRSLRIGIPRVAPSSDDGRVEAAVYTCVDGVPYATPFAADLPTGVADPEAVVIEVGTGVAADMLRQLGLPKAPDYCAWGEELSLTFYLPRPLHPALPPSPGSRCEG